METHNARAARRSIDEPAPVIKRAASPDSGNSCGVAHQLGLPLVNPRPYAAGAKVGGRFDLPRQLALGEAWRRPYVEVNPRSSYVAMTFDVDRLDTFWLDEVPAPSWYVRRGEHLHVGYRLGKPVRRGLRGGRRSKRLQAYEAVQGALGALWCADAPTWLTRNPLAPGDDCVTVWPRSAPYELEELLEWAQPELFDRRAYDVKRDGRNVRLFAWAVKAALMASNIGVLQREGSESSTWAAYVHYVNRAWFEEPLPADEVRSVAKSSARYALRQWRPDWHAWQGRKSGRARRKRTRERDLHVLAMRADGRSLREIARMVGLSRNAVDHVVRREGGVSHEL